jgi:type I restriction enzyme S subunit
MLLSNLNLLATAPGGVARLRELILTLAVQGKLVAQDPKDEPASELLKKIRAEKDRLIAAGKIKRDKPLAGITEEEKPFGLPVGWEWVRFSALAAFENGDRGSNYPSRSNFVDQGIAFINAGHLVDERIDFFDMNYITSQTFELLRSGKVQRGDILYCLRGSLGKFAQVTDDAAGAIASSLVIIRLSNKAAASYVMQYLKSPLAATLIKRFDNGTAQPNLGAGDLAKFVLPLPPLAEQSRVVTRVEELMRLCDALDAKGQLEAAQHAQLVTTLLGTLTQSDTPAQLAEAWQRLATHFDLLLDRPKGLDALEQTILQLAVRGLLVPQDPTDEPASELLKKIRLEKDRLILEGKIKRDKALTLIAEEEKPFGLPQGWEWVRVGQVSGRVQYGVTASADHTLSEPKFVRITDIQNDQVNWETVPGMQGIKQDVSDHYLEAGDLLIARTGGTIGKSFLVSVVPLNAVFASYLIRISPVAGMDSNYLKIFASSEHYWQQLYAKSMGTGQPNVNGTALSELTLPLPPLAEQSRIVTRVESLRRLCADLRQRLSASQSTQAQLAEALVAQPNNGETAEQ